MEKTTPCVSRRPSCSCCRNSRIGRLRKYTHENSTTSMPENLPEGAGTGSRRQAAGSLKPSSSSCSYQPSQQNDQFSSTPACCLRNKPLSAGFLHHSQAQGDTRRLASPVSSGPWHRRGSYVRGSRVPRDRWESCVRGLHSLHDEGLHIPWQEAWGCIWGF